MTACIATAGVAGVKAAGSGASIVALFHVMGLVASLSTGTLSDRFGRGKVMLVLAATSTICSFTFGWTLEVPLLVSVGIGAIYAFSSLGDSPVLSTALTEVVEPSYLGTALGFRSLVGFGAGAIAPLAFGAILDWSNPFADGQRMYMTWGWAFSVLGIGGLGAVWSIHRYGKM